MRFLCLILKELIVLQKNRFLHCSAIQLEHVAETPDAFATRGRKNPKNKGGDYTSIVFHRESGSDSRPSIRVLLSL